MKNIKIGVKLSLIVGFCFLGILVVKGLGLMELRKVMLEDRQVKTQHIVEAAHTVVKSFATKATAGVISVDEAKKSALKAVESMRYGGTEYFWVNDMNAVVLMHPIKPKLNGKNLADLKDKEGTRIFTEFVSTVKKDGAGFVGYLWPKPGFEEPVRKISYVKGFKDWGWVIGSGIYLDDVDTEFKSELIVSGSILAGTLLLAGLFAFFIGRSITGPIQQITDSMEGLAQGDQNVIIPAQDHRDEVGDMARSLDAIRAVGTRAAKVQSALDSVSSPVLMVDNEHTVTYVNQALKNKFARIEATISKALPSFSASSVIGTNFDSFHNSDDLRQGSLSTLGGPKEISFVAGDITMKAAASPVYSPGGDRLGSVVEFNDVTGQIAIENEVAGLVDAAIAGDYSKRLNVDGKEGFYLKLSEGMNGLTQTVERGLNEVVSIISGMADGDLTKRIDGDYQGAFARLKADTNSMACLPVTIACKSVFPAASMCRISPSRSNWVVGRSVHSTFN